MKQTSFLSQHRYLLILTLIAYFSWFFPLTSSFWNSLDHIIYTQLHSTLFFSQPWAKFWAFFNSNLSDRIQDLIVLAITLFTILSRKNKLTAKKFLIYYVTLTLLSILVKTILSHFLSYHRLSPSYLDPNHYDLKALFPSLHIKDKSSNSFPADHALFLMLWGHYIFYYSKSRQVKAFILLTVIFFSCPRLIAGAHAFSDLFFGALLPSMIFFKLYLKKIILKKDSPINDIEGDTFDKPSA